MFANKMFFWLKSVSVKRLEILCTYFVAPIVLPSINTAEIQRSVRQHRHNFQKLKVSIYAQPAFSLDDWQPMFALKQISTVFCHPFKVKAYNMKKIFDVIKAEMKMKLTKQLQRWINTQPHMLYIMYSFVSVKRQYDATVDHQGYTCTVNTCKASSVLNCLFVRKWLK